MSPTMRVRLEDESKPAVLKLYDHRFSQNLREEEKVSSWDHEMEEIYCRFVESGGADEFVTFLNSDVRDDNEGVWTDVQYEILLYDKCRDFYDAETLAYHTLRDLQGISIPKLLATTSFQTYVTHDPKFQKYFEIRGVLLEDCGDFTLETLADNAPTECWQGICDDAVSIVDSIGNYNVLHKDVRPGNFVVQGIQSNAGTKYKVVMIDFALSRVRQPDESTTEWRQAKRSQDEEGAVGYVMQIRLKNKGLYYTYKPSFRYYDDSLEEEKYALENLVKVSGSGNAALSYEVTHYD